MVRQHGPLRFSRIPIYGKDLDDILGVVHRYHPVQHYGEIVPGDDRSLNQFDTGT